MYCKLTVDQSMYHSYGMCTKTKHSTIFLEMKRKGTSQSSEDVNRFKGNVAKMPE